MSGNPLTLQIVGGFRILTEPPVERLRTRKTELLLAFLALNPAAHRRIEIIDRFWPEDDENAARQKLRLALNSIRNAVGDRLETDRESVRLRDMVVDLDAHLEDVRNGAAPATLLPDHHDPWADALRRGFAEDLADALRERARGQEDGAAVETLYRLVELDSSRLDDHRQLLKRLRQLGRRAAHDRHLAAMREVFDGLPPELASLPSGPSRTPARRDAFVGRESEIDRLAQALLGDAEPRWVTLVGPPGVGKSRLSQELLGIAPDMEVAGVFVPLADVEDEETLVQRIAGGLGSAGVIDLGRLAEVAMAAAPTLLVLDNLETMGSRARHVLEALTPAGCSLRLLATSQVAIGGCDEQVWEVAPLGDASGVRLFYDRARQVTTLPETAETREAVQTICRRLDGLPLAIELAASSLEVVTLDALRDDTRVRHVSLLDTIRRSFGLLSPSAQAFLRNLAIFPAGFTAASAEIAGPDAEATLRALLGRSMVSPARDEGPGRFRLLASIRAFLQKDADLTAARERHADHFREVCERIYARGSVPEEDRHDLPNAEAAFDVFLEQGRLREAGETMRGMFLLAQVTGQYGAAERRIRALYDRLGDQDRALRANVTALLASIAYFAGDADGFMAWSQRRMDDLLALGDSLDVARGRSNIGLAHRQQGRYREALAEYQAAFGPMKDAGMRLHTTIAMNISTPLSYLGRHEEAQAHLTDALETWTGTPGAEPWIGLLCRCMAEDAVIRGDLEEAASWLNRTMDLHESGGDALRLIEGSFEATWVDLLRGDATGAETRLRRMVEPMARMVHDRAWALALSAGAGVALAQGDEAASARLLGASERYARQMVDVASPALSPLVDAHLRPAAARDTDRRIGRTLNRRELTELMKRL